MNECKKITIVHVACPKGRILADVNDGNHHIHPRYHHLFGFLRSL